MQLTETPKFTVVVTVYEREHFIPRILHCLAAQQYTKWDAIFVYDGYSITSRQQVESFQYATDLPIRFFDAVTVAGKWGNPARRMGLQSATGDFVCFIGHDCLIDKDYLSVHADQIGRDSEVLSVVSCRYWTLREPITAQPIEHPRYSRIVPPTVESPLFSWGDVDLTCMAFPRQKSLEVGVFGPEDDLVYSADWTGFEKCRAVMPVRVSTDVVCAHF